MYERITPEQEQAVSNVLSSRHKTYYQSEVQRVNMPVCVEAAPVPVLYIPAMCRAVNTSSWGYNPVFAPHVSSSQASQPSLSGFQCHNCTFNIYQGPVSQPQNSGPMCDPNNYGFREKQMDSFWEY